jgi:hypothetical protein
VETEKSWIKFTKENVDNVPEGPGVYEIAHVSTGEKILWRLGKISNLRKRLLTRLHEPEPPENCYFRYYEIGGGEDVDAIAARIFDSYPEESHKDKVAKRDS